MTAVWLLLRSISPKTWLFLGIILALGIGLWWYGDSQYDRGAAAVQAEWDHDAEERRKSAEAAIRHRETENELLKADQQKRLAAQKRKYADEIAAIKRRRDELLGERLRLPETVCAGSAGKTEAEGTVRGVGDLAGTVALPESVERDLRELMEHADTIVAACRQAQQFITENGFEEQP